MPVNTSSPRTGTLTQVVESAMANGTPAGTAPSRTMIRPRATSHMVSAPIVTAEARTTVRIPMVTTTLAGTRRALAEPR